MHLGSIKTVGTFSNNNLKYVLLNNNCHDSVGGQKTYSENIDYKKLSMSVGFESFHRIQNIKNLEIKIKNFLEEDKLSFLEVRVADSEIKKLPRPNNLIKIRKNFMK